MHFRSVLSIAAAILGGSSLAGWVGWTYARSSGDDLSVGSSAVTEKSASVATNDSGDGLVWRLVEVKPVLSADTNSASGASSGMVDFGFVPRGLNVRARFSLLAPKEGSGLRLGRLLAGCDCVGAELSTRSLKPGETAFLDVTLHTGHLDGIKRYAVQAEVFDHERPTVDAAVQANVIFAPTDPLWQPSVFSWPDGVGKGTEASVVLMNLSESPLRVLSLKAEGEGFELADASPMALAGGSSRKIRVRRTAGGNTEGTTAASSMGQSSGAVVIETDRAANSTLRIPVKIL